VGLICNAEADDANPIELSMVDKANSAVAMARVVREHEFGAGAL
jgi:hypothetical protein